MQRCFAPWVLFGLASVGLSGTVVAQSAKPQPPNHGVRLLDSSVVEGVLALGGSDCAGGEIYDDGGAENGYSGNPSLISNFQGVQQFTPASYPSGYNTVCLGLVSLGGPALDFNIQVHDDDGPAGAPGTLLGTVAASAAGIPGGLPCAWYSFDISSMNLNIASGNVWIGVQWNPMSFPSRFICADESAATPLHPGFLNFNNPTSLWESTPTVFPAYRAKLIRALGGPSVPTIALDSFTSTDTCAAGAGGGNSIWEPGETITIPVTVVANDPFTGVTGTMTTSTPGVTIVDGTATWPNLADGVPTQSDAPHFTIRIDEAFSCLTGVDLDVSVTANEGGPFDFSFSQQVGASGVGAPTGLPLAVPDNNPAGANSTITIGSSTILTDVNVSIEMTHTWVGDLIITLDPPGAAPPITLLDRPGIPVPGGAGCLDDNMDVTFDDAAAVNPETHCLGTNPWLTGNVLSFAPLAALNGTDAQGVWTLNVSDLANLDLGTVVDWDLILTPVPAGQCEICVGQDVDLALAKSVAPSDVVPGDNAVFTLTVTNNGPGAATGVVVTDTLPPELVYVSNDCGAAFAAPTLTWNVGALAAAGSATCNVTVTVSVAGSFTNNASVAGNETDPTPANDAAAATVTGGLSVLEIPTLDKLGLALLALMIAAAAFVAIRRT
jgi:uncharacterized repeat protein (TIGR01451 family)